MPMMLLACTAVCLSDLHGLISVNVHPRIGLAVAALLLGVLDHVDAVQRGDHGRGAEAGQDGAEDPEQERRAGEEEPVADEVEQEAALEDEDDVVPVDGGEAERGVRGRRRERVDQEGGLVERADGEAVAEEGEQEGAEQHDVLERRHGLAVRAEHGVAQRLLHGVGAAQHGGHAGTEEDRRCAHQRRAHQHVPDRLNRQHRLLLVVLRAFMHV
jgi:hypothetical protein